MDRRTLLQYLMASLVGTRFTSVATEKNHPVEEITVMNWKSREFEIVNVTSWTMNHPDLPKSSFAGKMVNHE